jgi:hypothetical protein
MKASTQANEQSAIANRQLEMLLLLVFVYIDVLSVDDVIVTA